MNLCNNNLLMNGSKKTYKYAKEVLGSLGWALTQELQRFERNRCWLRKNVISIIKIKVTLHKLFTKINSKMS